MAPCAPSSMALRLRTTAVPAALLTATLCSTRPALADTDCSSVSDITRFKQCMGAGDVEEIILAADLAPAPGTASAYHTINIEGTPKSIEAGGFSLPFMQLYGDGAQIRINDGRYTLTSVDDLPQDDPTEDDLTPLSRYIIRVYGNTTLQLVGTKLELQKDSEETELPVTLVELRHSKKLDGVDIASADAATGATVFFDDIWNPTSSPLAIALAISAYDAEGASGGFALRDSKLYLGDDAVLHASRWRDGTDPITHADSYVEIQRTWLSPPPSEDSAATEWPTVGAKLADSGEVNLPLLSAANVLRIQTARFSQLKTHNIPLIVAPTVVLKNIMVDGIEETVTETGTGGAGQNDVGLALASDLLVQGSLICDVRETDFLLGAIRQTTDLDAPLSVYVLNSAIWNIEQSLARVDLSEDEWRAEDGGDVLPYSALVTANVTLHHKSAGGSGRRSAVVGGTDSVATQRAELSNTYLQGGWLLEDPAGRLTATRVVMHDRDRSAPCADIADCSDVDVPHLSEDFLARDCSDVMQSFAQPLLSEVTSGPFDDEDYPRYRFDQSLADLDAASFDNHARPALRRFTDLRGQPWSYPREYIGGWDTDERTMHMCAAGSDTPEVGAWSAPADRSCSIALTKPYESDASDTAEPGLAPEDSTPGGLSSDPTGTMHSLASDCRYSVAGVWLLLPLALTRRRRST